MKKHFISFGNISYKNSLKRIIDEASSINFFDVIEPYNEFSINSFIIEHNDFFLKNKRGYGYWIWKPYIIYEHLKKMSDGDILLYCDSGCILNINDISLKRLDEYFNLLECSEYDTLSFELVHKEKTWTKGLLYDFLNIEKDNSHQLMATAMFFKKNNKNLSLLKEICNIIENKEYYLFDDTISNNNDDSFIEHRHDQSIFSLLRKKLGTLILKDETWFRNWSDGINYPIHAKRIKQ
jgi:hypothetical protein